MITKDKLISNLKEYALSQVNKMAKGSPGVALLKPYIIRVIDNSTPQISKPLGLIADKNNNIDAENMISEMYTSIMNTSPFKINIPVVGEMEIGGGHIKVNIPIINKDLILNSEDLEELKQTLLKH